jgi:UDP-glucose 4-epimerase
LPTALRPGARGDLPAFWANADEARRILGWEARCSLLQMCEDTWRFQTQSAEAG